MSFPMIRIMGFVIVQYLLPCSNLQDRYGREEKKYTIFPEANISAVVLGSLILIITAAKRCKQTHHNISTVYHQPSPFCPYVVVR